MTDVDLCNMALVLIGDQEISTLDDANDRARAAKRFYAPTRDAVLRAHPWNFAIVRSGSLSPDATAPTFGWDYAFTLPTSPYCLRVLGINEEYEGEIPWIVEGRKLLTDEATVYIRYISRVTTVDNFDSLFTDTLSARLGAVFAISLTKQKTLSEMCWKLYADKIAEAQGINRVESNDNPQEYYNSLDMVRR